MGGYINSRTLECVILSYDDRSRDQTIMNNTGATKLHLLSHHRHQAVSNSILGQVKDKLDILLKHFVSHNNLDYWLTNDAYPM